MNPSILLGGAESFHMPTGNGTSPGEAFSSYPLKEHEQASTWPIHHSTSEVTNHWPLNQVHAHVETERSMNYPANARTIRNRGNNNSEQQNANINLWLSKSGLENRRPGSDIDQAAYNGLASGEDYGKWDQQSAWARPWSDTFEFECRIPTPSHWPAQLVQPQAGIYPLRSGILCTHDFILANRLVQDVLLGVYGWRNIGFPDPILFRLALLVPRARTGGLLEVFDLLASEFSSSFPAFCSKMFTDEFGGNRSTLEQKILRHVVPGPRHHQVVCMVKETIMIITDLSAVLVTDSVTPMEKAKALCNDYIWFARSLNGLMDFLHSIRTVMDQLRAKRD